MLEYWSERSLILAYFSQCKQDWIFIESLNHCRIRMSNQHCVKSVLIPSFSGPYFPACVLNMDKKNISLDISDAIQLALIFFCSNDPVLTKKSDSLKVYDLYHIHCVKSVQIRSNFWSAFSCIQSAYNTEKYGPEITPYLDTFHAVIFSRENRPRSL